MNLRKDHYWFCHSLGYEYLVNKLGMRGLALVLDRAIFEIAWSLSDCVILFLSHYREVELSYFE